MLNDRPRGFLLTCCVCGSTVGHCLSEARPAFVFCLPCTERYWREHVKAGDVERTARLHAAHAFAVAVADECEKIAEGGGK